MADSSSVTRTSGAYAIGGSVVGGLITAAVVGSQILGGFQYTDRTQVTSVQAKYGTGAYQVYVDANCTNTGVLQKYTHCTLANPLSGTAAIMRLQYDSYKAPNAPQIVCETASPNSTATGIVLRDVPTTSAGGLFYGTSGSGKSLAYLGSGFVLLPPSWTIRCWASKSPDTAYANNATLKNVKIRAWLNELNVP